MSRLASRLQDSLGLMPGEAPSLGWLFAHSLFHGTFSAFFVSAALALFLDQFEMTFLPYAYVASALVGYATVALHSGLARRLPRRWLLAADLALVLAIAGGLWLAALTTGSLWVSFALAVAVAPVLTLLDLEFWGLATRLFDLRQGKRLFGLVGAGEVVASVVGYFLVPVLVPRLGGPIHLIPIACAGLLACLAVLGLAPRAAPRGTVAPASHRGRARAAVALRELVRDRYFLLISLQTTLFVAANYLTDFGFLSQVPRRFHGASEVAQFFGVFYGAGKLGELAMKLSSGRLIGRFGLRFGLLALPATLLACILPAAALGAWLGPSAGIVFVFSALAKVVWSVLAKSTFDPCYRVLYQPLPSERQLAFQGRVEGTVKQADILLAGVGLVFFAARGGSAVPLYAGLIPALLAWMGVVFLLHREYRARLLAAVTARRAARPAVAPDPLVEHLLAVPLPALPACLAVLQRVDPATPVSLLLGILERGEPERRALVLAHLGRVRALAALPAVEAAAAAAAEPEVRWAAGEALETLRETAALARDPRRLAFLAAAADPAQRELAAMALGWNARPQQDAGGRERDELAGLLWDRGWEVRRAALVAAGRSGAAELRPRLLSHLALPAFANAAAAGAVAAGEPLVPELEAAFGKPSQAPEVRRRILGVCGRIGGERVRAFLLEAVRFPDPQVERRALLYLRRSGYRARRQEVALLARRIEQLVEGAAWDLAAIVDLQDAPGETPSPALAALRECLEGEVEERRRRLYLLLALLCDPQAIDLVEESLASGAGEAAVYGLEVMDVVVPPTLRPLVLPLMEELPPVQRLRRLAGAAPQRQLGRAARLAAILHRDRDRLGTWTLASALLALGELTAGDGGTPEGVANLVANLFHPDPLLQEVAGLALLRCNRDEYERAAGKLLLPDRARLARVVGQGEEGAEEEPEEEQAGWESRSVFGKAVHLRGIPAFAALPRELLAHLAGFCEERRLAPGDRLPAARDAPTTLYLVLEGRLAPAGGEGEGAGKGAILLPARTAPVEAREPSRALRLDGDRLVLAAGDYPELLLALLRVVARHAGAEGAGAGGREDPGEGKAPVPGRVLAG